MSVCAITKQINDHLSREDEEERKAEYEQSIIDDKREFMLNHFVDLTVEQVANYLQSKYDFDLADYLEDHMRDDGNFEYFVLRRDSYYKKAMLNILDELDFDNDIAHQMEIDEERALGI